MSTQYDFGCLPVPYGCCYDALREFKFTRSLNILYAASATFTVANLYYCQPILVELSNHFNVSYQEVTKVPSLLQAGYLLGLVFLSPLADLIPRRQGILGLVIGSLAGSILLVTTESFAAFQAFAFFTGLCSITPQVLNPLVADLANPEERARSISLVIAGLVTGMSFARVFAGLITHYSNYKMVFVVASITQFITLVFLWFSIPNYPRKNTELTYFQILRSMIHLLMTEPLLVQACLIGYASCTIFVSWWTTLTFLLTASPYQYDTLHIGLFGLCGVVVILSASTAGRINDWLLPYVGTLLGLSLQLLVAVVALSGASVSLGAVIFVCIFTDLAQQSQQLGNQTRIYSISPLARGRLNACYMMSVFLGQVTGSSAGSIVYLHYGPRASYGMSVGFSLCGILLLLIRGPGSTKKQWFGWNGVWSLRKEIVLKARERQEEEEKEEETRIEIEEEKIVNTIEVEVEEGKETKVLDDVKLSDIKKKIEV